MPNEILVDKLSADSNLFDGSSYEKMLVHKDK